MFEPGHQASKSSFASSRWFRLELHRRSLGARTRPATTVCRPPTRPPSRPRRRRPPHRRQHERPLPPAFSVCFKSVSSHERRTFPTNAMNRPPVGPSRLPTTPTVCWPTRCGSSATCRRRRAATTATRPGAACSPPPARARSNASAARSPTAQMARAGAPRPRPHPRHRPVVHRRSSCVAKRPFTSSPSPTAPGSGPLS